MGASKHITTTLLQPVGTAEGAGRRPSLRTPDAIHVASAFACGCSLLLTNDPHFQTAGIVPTLILDEVADAAAS
jgi:predicted nucleic acid-binding protein